MPKRSIASLLRRYRKEQTKRRGRTFTQRDLATLLGVTPASISGWERGNVIPRDESVERLVRLLGPIVYDALPPPETDTPSTLGEHIVVARQKRGMTQAELGRRLGVRAESVCRWEKGAVSPDLSTIHHIAQILQIRVFDLFPPPSRPAETPEGLSLPDRLCWWRQYGVPLRGTPYLSARDVALDLGISPATVGAWESGRTTPTAYQLARLSQLYGVALDELLDDSQREEYRELREPSTVGDRLVVLRFQMSLREGREITRTNVAEELPSSPAAVYQWENDVVVPHPHYLESLAFYYNTTVDFILNDQQAVRGGMTPSLDQPQTVGDRIRLRRIELGVETGQLMSLNRFSQKAGIQQSRLLSVEKDRELPTPEEAQRIAEALEVEPEAIFGVDWQTSLSPKDPSAWPKRPEDLPTDTLGQRIRYIRWLRGRERGEHLHREELGASLGVSVHTLRCWEQGTRPLKKRELHRVAKVLGVEPDFLLDGEGTPSKVA